MLSALGWYFSSSLIGWLCFPLFSKLFPKLPSKGFAFARAGALLVWGYLFWLLNSFGILKNTLVDQLIVLGVLILGSLVFTLKSGIERIRHWLSLNWRFFLCVELVFLSTFGLFVLFRAFSPAIHGTEKPMELAFLNGILRSESFPPHDPWLAGYSISYYYFGYLLVAMLTRLTRVASTVAFNLAQALWFGMAAAGAYGLLVDLLWLRRQRNDPHPISTPPLILRWALIAPILLLLIGNAFGFLDIFHARGVFWNIEPNLKAKSSFWAWLGIKELDQPPPFPTQWQPQRSSSVIWWRASRVVQDQPYQGDPVEVIDEFPNFSFVLGDLHPHLLALPFCLLAIGLALNAFVESDLKHFSIGKLSIPFDPLRFLFVGGVIGSLAFINTWDWPLYVGLYTGVRVFKRATKIGWQFIRLLEFVFYGVCLGLIGFLFYLPFFLNFSSQASGFLPSVIYFTRGVQFWVMFFPLLGLIGVYLTNLLVKRRVKPQWRKAIIVLAIFVMMLIILNIGFTLIASAFPDWKTLFMKNQGAGEIAAWTLLWHALIRRLSQPGAWLTLTGMLIVCLAMLFERREKPNETLRVYPFVLLLIFWGCLLTFIPEFIYLLDYFGKRMNTIFKFYFQAWILWSIAGAYGIAVLCLKKQPKERLVNLIFFWGTAAIACGMIVLLIFAPNASVHPVKTQAPGFGVYILDWMMSAWIVLLAGGSLYFLLSHEWSSVARMGIILCLTLGGIYPALAIPHRAKRFQSWESITLDGSADYRSTDPDLMAAVDWLAEKEWGVLVEAVGPNGGDYSEYGRVSMLTGLPTVLGWRFHELQWRGSTEEIGSRQEDVQILYETNHWEATESIIAKYNIRYVFIGDLERETYQLNIEKFDQYFSLVFQKGLISIYQTGDR